MLEFVSDWAYDTIGLAGSIILFLIGFAALIKGGDWFVDGSVGIAKKFHIPELLIGATVVSIGTTLPEVMVSASAAAKGVALAARRLLLHRGGILRLRCDIPSQIHKARRHYTACDVRDLHDRHRHARPEAPR